MLGLTRELDPPKLQHFLKCKIIVVWQILLLLLQDDSESKRIAKKSHAKIWIKLVPPRHLPRGVTAKIHPKERLASLEISPKLKNIGTGLHSLERSKKIEKSGLENVGWQVSEFF